eukprot:218522-Chlamydomonas_euryale.AAC.8
MYVAIVSATRCPVTVSPEVGCGSTNDLTSASSCSAGFSEPAAGALPGRPGRRLEKCGGRFRPAGRVFDLRTTYICGRSRRGRRRRFLIRQRAGCAAEPIVSQTWTALVVVRDSNPRGIQVTMSQAPKATASSRRPANLGRPQSTPLPVLGTSQGRPSGASDLAPSGELC